MWWRDHQNFMAVDWKPFSVSSILYGMPVKWNVYTYGMYVGEHGKVETPDMEDWGKQKEWLQETAS